MAFISMRTAFKFKGLVNISGFHVDPGYKGKLIFAVFNASPTKSRGANHFSKSGLLRSIRHPANATSSTNLQSRKSTKSSCAE
jgi:hypothetical protein